MTSNFEELVGRTIASISIDTQSEHYLSFATDAGPINYLVEGDCCSNSYFAEVLNVANLLGGGRVAKVENMEFQGEPVKLPRDEEVSVYGYRVTMEDGSSAPIVFRNSSNGYYGGWMERCESVPEARMRALTSDYRAE